MSGKTGNFAGPDCGGFWMYSGPCILRPPMHPGKSTLKIEGGLKMARYLY